MIEPKDHWHPFQSDDEMLIYLKDHQLLSQRATEAKPMYYRGAFSDTLLPCQVVGWQDTVFAVIRVNGTLHTIHPDHLADLQPKKAELNELDLPALPTEEPDYLQFSLGSQFAEEAPLPKSRPISSPAHTENYTVIDLETTGLESATDEIIEVAALRVRNGAVVDRFQSLIRCCSPLSPIITDITGIKPEDLASAPTLESCLPSYLAFLGDDCLVGHNVGFDTGFLAAACAKLGLPAFHPATVDTLKLSRKKLSLPSYKLTEVRIALNLPEHNAHRALDDCQTTMEVYEALKQRKETAKRSSGRNFRGAPLERHRELYPDTVVSGPNSPFYGANCVLTGELHIDRSEAEAMLTEAGAILKSSVSQKTNLLIVGVQDPSLVGVSGLSSKEKKAMELNRSGKASIQILNETQLCAMLAGAPAQDLPQESSIPEGTHSTEPDAEEEEQASFFQQDSLEEQTFHLMESSIRTVIAQNFLEESQLRMQQMSSYWSVSYASSLIARIRFGKNASYCSLDASAAVPLLEQAGIVYERKQAEPSFVRIPLRVPEDILPCLPVLAAVTQRALDLIPKEFDCCSRVDACSHAKHCVNPSSTMSIGCGYRKILASGRIFYGPNRNTDT